MPTYVYECTKCKFSFELEQRITDAPRKRCPNCSSKVIRVITAAGGYILKGSGFYVTDYRSKDYTKRAEADMGRSSGETRPGEEKKKHKKKI